MAGFHASLNHGYARPVRFKRGEGVNVWGAPINALAYRLDSMDVSPEVADALRDLFEEIGQMAKDAQALGGPNASELNIRLGDH